jgi:hypothetical protein
MGTWKMTYARIIGTRAVVRNKAVISSIPVVEVFNDDGCAG